MPSERKLKNVDRYTKEQSKKIAVRTCAGQFENEDIFVNLINEKPIGRDVTFTMICPIAGERMVAVDGRQFFAIAQLLNDRLQLFNRQMPLHHQFIVPLEGGSMADIVFHLAKSFHNSLRSEYVRWLGFRAMRSPSSIAAMVSALGICEPSIIKGMRFSRITVLMYTLMTDDAESPTSSQKCVKRSLVCGSREIVMLAMVKVPFFAVKTSELYANVA